MVDDSFSLRARVRRRIVGQVQDLFHDRELGEKPVARSDNALFPAGSIIWRVHGDVTTMMIGGVSALLLQMLHPAVLAGVWDHSNFRTDMVGRLRRTARFIGVTTFGDRKHALESIARVRKLHDHVAGTLLDGTDYEANDPRLLAWVHVTEAWSFLNAWQRYGDCRLSVSEEDEYFREFATLALALGAKRVPTTRADTAGALESGRHALCVDDRTREVARRVIGHMPDNPLAVPLQRVTMRAAIDLLPAWARRMHRLAASPPPMSQLVKTGALGLATTLRWAFAAR